MITRLRLRSLLLLLLGGAIAGMASTITIDENGNGNIDGTPLTFTVAPDPVPGGSAAALIYTLPSSVGPITTGGLALLDGALIDDVLRFEAGNMIVFYSAAPPPGGAGKSLADQASPPSLVPNTVTASESGGAGNDSTTWIPTAGQPGFSSTSSLTYHIVSDSPADVPEPSAMVMALLGGICLIGQIFHKQRNA